MPLVKSRIEISEALAPLKKDGVGVYSSWPKEFISSSVVYRRTNTSDGMAYGTEEGSLDTILQYTIYVVGKTLLETEVLGDKVIKIMKEIGYSLGMTDNSSDNQLVLMFVMEVDNTTNISFGRR